MENPIVKKMMTLAIDLAKKAGNRTLPNPRVGAVIFDDAGNVLGSGYHSSFGSMHAEVEAISDAVSRGYDPRGQNICVTLEPCNHHGKTPPCTKALLDAGIKAVYIGTKDDCPGVCGCGLEDLSLHGTEVYCGILEEECRALNPGFNKFNSKGLPFVRIKSAISLNAKISDTADKASVWFTGEEARSYVHYIRSCSDLIITGLGTVKTDNPMLNVRPGVNQETLDTGGASAVSSNVAVLDPKLELLNEYASGELNISKAGNRLFVVCGDNVDVAWALNKLRDAKVTLIKTSLDQRGLIDLKPLFKKLSVEYGFREIMIEAGAELTSSCLMLGPDYVDVFNLFIAPVWFNKDAKSLFNGSGMFPHMRIVDTRLFGNTVCLEMSFWRL